jgi:hypothetical protein
MKEPAMKWQFYFTIGCLILFSNKLRIAVTHKKNQIFKMFTIVNLKNRFDNLWGSVAVSNSRSTLIEVLFSLTCAIVSDLSFCEGEGLEKNIIIISLPFKKHVVTSIESKAATTCSQQTQHC